MRIYDDVGTHRGIRFGISSLFVVKMRSRGSFWCLMTSGRLLELTLMIWSSSEALMIAEHNYPEHLKHPKGVPHVLRVRGSLRSSTIICLLYLSASIFDCVFNLLYWVSVWMYFGIMFRSLFIRGFLLSLHELGRCASFVRVPPESPTRVSLDACSLPCARLLHLFQLCCFLVRVYFILLSYLFYLFWLFKYLVYSFSHIFLPFDLFFVHFLFIFFFFCTLIQSFLLSVSFTFYF